MSPTDQGARDRDALALATGQLVGVTGGAIGETEVFEESHAWRYEPSSHRHR